ncbi:alpha/beta-Hydrolases superfamily protein [Actinidia rufa]|uniref:Alpha/beta-Hydrolases superfamily protein n=1 Tax=Actinidia rufa TaxID=165716 RepID=A0A7J0FSY1_9ERIC|nr:alpha/beta-Hydrolases superfamily protein [Actinidia rufa]
MRTRETLSPKTHTNPIPQSIKWTTTTVLTATRFGNPSPLAPKQILALFHGHSHPSIFFAPITQSSLLSSPIVAPQWGPQIDGSDWPEKKILRIHVPIEQRRRRGKYSDGPSPADEWFKRGKIVKAHPVLDSDKKAKDPIFGLAMGSGSQSPDDVFSLFVVPYCTLGIRCHDHSHPEMHAYSYRKVLPILSKDYHAIGLDWLEYVSSLESLLNEVAIKKVSLVAQGYFAPVVVKYASSHQEKINNLILLNPPDPLRASDKALTSCGPYKMKEEDAMVYRRPYLTSGSSGFALNAISRAMKKELKTYVEEMRTILTDKSWNVQTTICWGQRDRWLGYDGVEDFCDVSKHRLIELPMAGHHVQEDCGEELAQIIAGIISKKR